MADRAHVVSIDLGTGGPKVALVDSAGAIAASAARPVATRHLPAGGAEQDPEEIWGAIADAVREVVREGGVPVAEIAAVGVASQYFSIVPVASDGTAVGNLVLWMDRRGAPHSIAIYGRHPEAFDTWVERHGIPPLPSGNDSLSHMLWLQQEQPSVYARAAALLEPADFVAARLTGRPTANPCTAFSMLLTDNRHPDAVDWDPELLRMSGVDREKLPELVPKNARIGPLDRGVAASLGLSPETAVFAPVNDTQAVAVGTGAVQGAHAGVNMGTTTAIVTHVPWKRSDLESEIVSMPSPMPGSWVAMAENGLGARALDAFLRDVVFARDAIADHRTADPFRGVEEAVRAVPPGSGGLLFLPWLVGSSAPSSNAKARGGFLNLTLGTSRAAMARSIMEGVAYNLRWLLPAVERFAERELDHLRLAGGAALSAEWCQIVADVAGKPVRRLADPRHVINRASAFLALEQLGVVGAGDLDRFCPLVGTFAPRAPAREVYDRIFPQFLAAFEQNRPIFENLNS
jgi:xylulokinase